MLPRMIGKGRGQLGAIGNLEVQLCALSIMNQDELRETGDTLETFLLLKRQNLLIYAWMELKKRSKRAASLRGSRTSSFYLPSTPNPSGIRPRTHIQPTPTQTPQSKHPLELAGNRTPIHDTPKITRRQLRLATEHLAPKEGFDTFNKEGNRMTLTEKFSYEHSQLPQGQSQKEEVEDSDEFEDIVLDRLSRLEENINRLMRDKRLKDQQRGYVGNPIVTPQPYYSQPQPKRLPAPGSILERKRLFFESLQQRQTEEGRDVIYNLKYIPQQTINPSIQKIRHMFHNTVEEENFIDGVDYFNNANPRQQLPNEPRTRVSNSLYIKRPAQGQRDFLGRDLQMQTVIEPTRRRYLYRESMNSSEAGDMLVQKEYSAKDNHISAHY